MKTYKDLEFKPHPIAIEMKAVAHKSELQRLYEQTKDGQIAHLNFENGYGISVIKDCPFITMDSKFEIAVLRDGSICYDTPITDDVMRMELEDEVSDVMRRIQAL